MRSHWRNIFGPVLVGVIAALIVAADYAGHPLPNPGAFILSAIAFAAFFSGLYAGLASAAGAILFAAIYLSRQGALFSYRPDDLTRLLLLAISAPCMAVMIGWLRAERDRALTREHGHSASVSTLRAALDRVDCGVALLDSELRAQFLNRAFRRLFRLPDAKADAKLPFVALMYHGRDTHAWAMPDSEVDGYVADRVARVRAGDSRPLDIQLASGEIVRFLCTPLPDGGRMLIYVPVTDLLLDRTREQPMQAAE